MTATLPRASAASPSALISSADAASQWAMTALGEIEERAHELPLARVRGLVVAKEVVGRPDDPDAGPAREPQLQQGPASLERAHAAAAGDVGLRPVEVDDVRPAVSPKGLHDRKYATGTGGIGPDLHAESAQLVGEGALVGVGGRVVGQEEDAHVAGRQAPSES